MHQKHERKQDYLEFLKPPLQNLKDKFPENLLQSYKQKRSLN